MSNNKENHSYEALDLISFKSY